MSPHTSTLSKSDDSLIIIKEIIYFVIPRRFTDKPRYYNLLLSAWEQRYSGISREAGRLVLEQLCRSRHHLKVSVWQYDCVTSQP